MEENKVPNPGESEIEKKATGDGIGHSEDSSVGVPLQNESMGLENIEQKNSAAMSNEGATSEEQYEITKEQGSDISLQQSVPKEDVSQKTQEAEKVMQSLPRVEADDFSLKAASFYTENYTKPKAEKKIELNHLILVSIISSITGALFMSLIFLFIIPAMQGPTTGFFSKLSGNKVVYSDNSGLPVRKIEIAKSESPVSAVAEKVSPSIVGIRVTYKATNFFFEQQQGSEEGSGIIIRSDGLIITNNHVIESAATNKGAKIEVILPNKKDEPVAAEIVGRDPKTDLAVVKINGQNLPAVEFGDSDKIRVGEMTIAIGNPGGIEYLGSVTTGVVSGLNRTIPLSDNTQLKLIQTDAAINPGNSGGALLNSQGQVIGVNTAKIGGSGYEGLGFAIPINKVKEITDSLINYKYVKGRPQLGVVIDQRYTESYAKQRGYPMGLLVEDVSPLSGAYKGGIRQGDLITKFNGKEVKSFAELETLKNSLKPGEKVKVEVYRDEKTMTLEVELSEDKGVG